jgi:hypothetical protein
MGSVDVHMAVEDLVQMDLGQASRLKELKVCGEMDRLFDQLQEATAAAIALHKQMTNDVSPIQTQ